MKAQVEIITPAYAKQLLEQNPGNRRLSEALATKYAADMKAERWVNNGQGIVLDADGNMLDGQHRARAVIIAGVPVAMLVVRGVPREAFRTMDSGKARTVGHVLGISGYKSTTVVASAARNSLLYITGGSLHGGGNRSYAPTKAEMIEFIERHPYIATIGAQVDAACTPAHAGPLAAVLFLANNSRKLDAEVETFIEGLSSGAGLFKGDPRLTLREWFLSRRGGTSARASHAYVVTAKAWTAHATGQAMLLLRVPEAANRTTIPIFGFDRSAFPEVSDAPGATPVKVKSNLPKRLAVAPLQFGEAA